MQPELEVGHDAEIATTTAHGPEQISVLLRARVPQLAIRIHDVDGFEIVDREAELASQPPEPAAEREPADARVRDGAEWCGQTLRQAFVVHLPEQRAALHPRAALLRIHAYSAQ